MWTPILHFLQIARPGRKAIAHTIVDARWVTHAMHMPFPIIVPKVVL